MDAHFAGVHLRLDTLSRIPDRVDGHERTLVNHEARLLHAERELSRDDESGTFWRRFGFSAGVSLALSAPGWVALLIH